MTHGFQPSPDANVFTVTSVNLKVAHASSKMKATNYKVTVPFLKLRVGDGRYGTSKWIQFCYDQMEKGRAVFLTEARDTVSKYVTVTGPFDLQFKVRFSNHKPIKFRELRGDCDFFVGICNFGTTTLDDAIKATEEYFNVGERSRESSCGLGQAQQDKSEEKDKGRTA